MGERIITAIDLNRNGVVDYGSDTVSYTETEPAMGTILASVGSEPLMLTTSKVWQPGQTSFATGTTVFTSMRSSDGLRSSSQSIGVANPSRSLTVLSGNGNWTSTSTAPDSTKQIQTYTNGLLVSTSSRNTENATLANSSYSYDSLNRPITQTDSRTGTSITEYHSSGVVDVVTKVIDPGNRETAFTYDVRGRRIAVDAPDSLDADNNTLANITTTTYNPDSTVAETTGDQTYRTTHTYDYAQRQVTMTTYGSTTATTYWTYSPTRGFLTRKAYHNGKGTEYTYTAAGRLYTRGWARAVGTSYAYDAGGRLTSTTYSDDTPDVAVSYDALGRQTSQSNGVATTTYSYDSATLALDTETIAYNLDGNPGADFTRVIDRSRDNLSRDTGWKVGTIAQYNAGWVDENDDPDLENETVYTYGATDGRLASVGRGDTPVPQSFAYSYLANSNLLATITGPAHIVTNTWASDRNVLDLKENKIGTTLISSYNYSVNSLGQRSNVAQAGTAFAATRNINWGYDQYGQVTSADSDNSSDDRAYQYDAIGNRLKSADSLTLPTSNNYTPNALNQYAAVSTLNPGYDLDGNMTSGPLPAAPSANSILIWDGENRLISTTVNGTTTTYQYDSQSRRITKTTGANTAVYVYDGWNVIGEYQAGTLTKSHLWGMDLSGSMQGAGGVGGLLSTTDSSGTQYPTYDGNGNVSEYLDSTGAITAHFEYDPFGRTVVNTDSGGQFLYRYSTKPIDTETGFYYYGYRYYDPVTGRWPSRDPIAEACGINLYGFVANDGVGKCDFLGMYLNALYAFDSRRSGDMSSYQQGIAEVGEGIGYARSLRAILEGMSDDEFYEKTKNGVFARWYVDGRGEFPEEAKGQRDGLRKYNVDVSHASRSDLIRWMLHEEQSSVHLIDLSDDVPKSSIYQMLDTYSGSEDYLFDSLGFVAHGNPDKGGILIGPDPESSVRIPFQELRNKMGEMRYFESRALISCGANDGKNVSEGVISDTFFFDYDNCELTFTPLQIAFIFGGRGAR